MNAQKKNVAELCQFDPKDVNPKIVNAGKEEFLLIGPGGLGVFTSSSGISERPPIIWHDKVNEIAVDGLNVVAAGNDVIYVNSLHDPTTSNVIPFPGVKCLALTEGKLYVGTARSLYRFTPISVDEQVESLINAEKIDQALNLLELAHVKDEKREYLRRRILRKAVFLRMHALELTSCMEAIRESHIDLREIISLFPTILPSNTVFTRSLPSLHEFIDVNQMVAGDPHKARTLASFLLAVLTTHETMPDSKDLSTSAIKLAAKYDKSQYIIILDHVSCMEIDYDDCFEWMEDYKYFDCAALLYKAKGDVRKALDLWVDLLSNTKKCEDPDEFEGVDVVIETLLSSVNANLIWEYYDKLLKYDPIKAVEVFTKRELSPSFQPLNVAEKLSSNRPICMLYLRHCIFEKKLDDEDLHTYLATLYIDEIVQETNASDVERLRTEFRQLLISSDSLKVQFLIGRLQKTQLRLELAILHGKAGDHDPALKVIVEELHDYNFASEYCIKISDSSQREKAFMSLLKIYLNAKDKPEIIEACMHLLTNHAEEFDFSIVLPLLPDEWNIRSLSDLLHRVLRTHLHRQRRVELLKGLSERIDKDYRLEADANNQGYILDEDSVCGLCHRKLDNLEPVFYNKGFIVHSKCI
ncbi:Transforming growth factor-beta receptor-associated protein 1 [Orchesella cincta]|uniref:Transforming growth factor-beta receptor-associated protein 1 n=1 Tax=Orchesella cincta TaxID=48709 RepID=A0A1D2N041_ORCCI|nr:Transforming growth factor-beta receptor-associated protein 1 [Orchesella cincta]